MRKKALFLLLFLCVASAFSKDVITKSDGTKLDAKVEEITETVIKYRKASNPPGPVYTIPITSVASILYENGDSDIFGESTSFIQEAPPQLSTPSDDELIQMVESQSYSNLKTYLSDSELIRMVDSSSSNIMLEKAKKYKKIGWIGGGSILAVGVITGFTLWGIWSFDACDFEGCGSIMLISLGAAAVWTLGFNLKANSIIKQVSKMQSYSATIIENEIMQFGNNSLTAGINVMGNRMVNSHSLGLSLGLNF